MAAIFVILGNGWHPRWQDGRQHVKVVIDWPIFVKLSGVDPNLMVFNFYCKSLSSILEKWQPFLWFWVMADIQDGRQHVEVVDWPKLSGVRFLLSLSLILEKWQPFLWFWVNIQDGRQHVKVVNWPKLSGVKFLLQVPIIDFREMAAIFVILGNGWHPRWPTTCQSCQLTQT